MGVSFDTCTTRESLEPNPQITFRWIAVSLNVCATERPSLEVFSATEWH